MESQVGKLIRDTWPVWQLLGALLVVAVMIFVWGIDRNGADTTPPSAAITSQNGTVTWNGVICLDLERWTGSEWERLAYASYEDATRGVWGPPTSGDRFCELPAIDGSVSLPADSAPGTYRVCNIGAQPDCVEFRLSPG